MSQISTDQRCARLGRNHGYRIDGDTAQLHAEVEILNASAPASDWALQLWACDHPYAGGPLTGLKIAEAEVTAVDYSQTLGAEAQARVIGGERDYAMVLVLASGDAGHYDQVLDFANYPARERFITPHFAGSAGYSIEDRDVVLRAETICSPRSSDNLSGSLSLELWALPAPYQGGDVDGQLLGRADLGRLLGQHERRNVEERVPFSPPPAGRWEIVLMLREWAGPAGFVTRDYSRFDAPYVSGEEAAVTLATTSTGELPADGRPSVNSATEDELTQIKGVTRAVARSIVERRPYTSLDALIDVHGIGPKTLEKLRAALTL